MDTAEAEKSSLVARVIPADQLPEELLIRQFRNEPEFPFDRGRWMTGIEPC